MTNYMDCPTCGTEDAMVNDGTVYQLVPQLYRDEDCELNVLGMLEYIMRDNDEILDDDEKARIAKWFYSRYSYDP